MKIQERMGAVRRWAVLGRSQQFLGQIGGSIERITRLHEQNSKADGQLLLQSGTARRGLQNRPLPGERLEAVGYLASETQCEFASRQQEKVVTSHDQMTERINLAKTETFQGTKTL